MTEETNNEKNNNNSNNKSDDDIIINSDEYDDDIENDDSDDNEMILTKMDEKTKQNTLLNSARSSSTTYLRTSLIKERMILENVLGNEDENASDNDDNDDDHHQVDVGGSDDDDDNDDDDDDDDDESYYDGDSDVDDKDTNNDKKPPASTTMATTATAASSSSNNNNNRNSKVKFTNTYILSNSTTGNGASSTTATAATARRRISGPEYALDDHGNDEQEYQHYRRKVIAASVRGGGGRSRAVTTSSSIASTSSARRSSDGLPSFVNTSSIGITNDSNNSYDHHRVQRPGAVSVTSSGGGQRSNLSQSTTYDSMFDISTQRNSLMSVQTNNNKDEDIIIPNAFKVSEDDIIQHTNSNNNDNNNNRKSVFIDELPICDAVEATDHNSNIPDNHHVMFCGNIYKRNHVYVVFSLLFIIIIVVVIATAMVVINNNNNNNNNANNNGNITNGNSIISKNEYELIMFLQLNNKPTTIGWNLQCISSELDHNTTTNNNGESINNVKFSPSIATIGTYDENDSNRIIVEQLLATTKTKTTEQPIQQQQSNNENIISEIITCTFQLIIGNDIHDNGNVVVTNNDKFNSVGIRNKNNTSLNGNNQLSVMIYDGRGIISANNKNIDSNSNNDIRLIDNIQSDYLLLNLSLSTYDMSSKTPAKDGYNNTYISERQFSIVRLSDLSQEEEGTSPPSPVVTITNTSSISSNAEGGTNNANTTTTTLSKNTTITVIIQLDEYPQETGWKLICDNVTIIDVPTKTYSLHKHLLINETVVIPTTSPSPSSSSSSSSSLLTCMFVIVDSFGDGLRNTYFQNIMMGQIMQQPSTNYYQDNDEFNSRYVSRGVSYYALYVNDILVRRNYNFTYLSESIEFIGNISDYDKNEIQSSQTMLTINIKHLQSTAAVNGWYVLQCHSELYGIDDFVMYNYKDSSMVQEVVVIQDCSECKLSIFPELPIFSNNADVFSSLLSTKGIYSVYLGDVASGAPIMMGNFVAIEEATFHIMPPNTLEYNPLTITTSNDVSNSTKWTLSCKIVGINDDDIGFYKEGNGPMTINDLRKGIAWNCLFDMVDASFYRIFLNYDGKLLSNTQVAIADSSTSLNFIIPDYLYKLVEVTLIIGLDNNPEQFGWTLECNSNIVANISIGSYSSSQMMKNYQGIINEALSVGIRSTCVFTLVQANNNTESTTVNSPCCSGVGSYFYEIYLGNPMNNNKLVKNVTSMQSTFIVK